MLEAAEGDMVFEDGQFKVAGTDRQKSFGEVAFQAYVPHNFPLETLEPGLEENAFYDPKNFTFPAGAYVCEVEIDPETGYSLRRGVFNTQTGVLAFSEPQIASTIDCRLGSDGRLELVWTSRQTGIQRIARLRKLDRKSTRLNSSHSQQSRMPSSA